MISLYPAGMDIIQLNGNLHVEGNQKNICENKQGISSIGAYSFKRTRRCFSAL